MKKVLFLMLGIVAAASAHAQQNTEFSIVKTSRGAFNHQARTTGHADGNSLAATGNGPAARGTATAFVTEDFSSGTPTSLPTGWTASNSTSNPVRWHWINRRSGGAYSIPSLNSTSAANGWMIFDSDSAGAQPGFAPPLRGYLTSPAYICTGHANIQLSFQQYFRRYQDTCAVDVSNDGGVTWTHYMVNANNSLGNTTYLSSNPHTARINISATAGNQADVKIRFNYITSSADGSYNWLVDDVALSDMDAVDAGINKSAMLYESPLPDFSPLSSYTAIPAQLTDSLFPFSFINNYGINDLSNVNVNASITRGATQVYNQSLSYSSLPSGGEDSLVQNPAALGYVPQSIGDYVALFSVNQSNDGNITNNTDTFRFATTDTIFSTSRAEITGTYALHSSINSTTGELNNYYGSKFDIPAGKSDTATSISASFNSRTTPGSNVIAQIYKLDLDAGAWAYMYETATKTLTAADISTTTTPVMTTLRINNNGPAILDEGIYAVVLQAINVADTATVLLNSTMPAFSEPGLTGFPGQSSESNGDGTIPFASTEGLATGLSNPARVTLNFGTYRPLAVGAVPAKAIAQLYPNPANGILSVKLTNVAASGAALTLSNTIGQALATQRMDQGTGIATFSTAALANGVYYITITAGGEHMVRKFVVIH